jgi:hypothetical protein
MIRCDRVLYAALMLTLATSAAAQTVTGTIQGRVTDTSVDPAPGKNFRLPWQGHVVSVRLDAFNALDTVKFGFPVNDIANVNFGRLTGGATGCAPRTLQLVLRYQN